jgi:hypothetical protein
MDERFGAACRSERAPRRGKSKEAGMIRSLRTTHRAIWIVLAILLPLILALALRARHERPVNSDDSIRRAVTGVPR